MSSLFLWWGLIGGILMVYLYSVAGGVLGPMAGWLMLLFIMVTLYDAQFPIYDTFIGRTTCDAIAATRLRGGRVNNFFHNLLPAGLRNRPYRFWYFVVVTVAVLAGFWMVLQTSPFIIWLAGSVAYLINQGLARLQAGGAAAM